MWRQLICSTTFRGSCLLLLAFFLLATACRQGSNTPNSELRNLDLLRGELITCSDTAFGEVRFSLSCNPDIRKTFDLAVSLLHSFEYAEAEKAFVKVIDADPDCAMAYWGVAMSLYHALWAPPSETDLIKGERVLEIAKSLPKTPREQEYLESIGQYFADWRSIDHRTRAQKMADRMQQIYEKHPEDSEAAILYALVLKATADPTDTTKRNERKAGRILEGLFPDQPNHPGIAHYIIHNYDNPVLAEQALETARQYAQIAPGSAHAQHMPSHIFTRLGLWDESIASNLRSTESARCYAESAGFQGHWDEELHGMDYLVYAYLQQGKKDLAEEQQAYLLSMQTFYPENFKVAYALAAIPARMTLETRQWEEAAALELPAIAFPWDQFPWQLAIHHFARGVGAAQAGMVDKSEDELVAIDSLMRILIARGNDYQANQVSIQAKALEALIQQARGNDRQAVSLMQQAADLEDQTAKHPVTPGEILPARELLGDLYLALDMPAAALSAYQRDLKGHPGRLNGLCGAFVAAVRAGENGMARTYLAQLEELCAGALPERENLVKARHTLETLI